MCAGVARHGSVMKSRTQTLTDEEFTRLLVGAWEQAEQLEHWFEGSPLEEAAREASAQFRKDTDTVRRVWAAIRG